MGWWTGLGALLCFWAVVEAQLWKADGGDGFADADLTGVVVNREGALVLEAMDPQRNLALGQAAEDEFGRVVPFTDGEITLGISEWVSGTPNVFGRNFTVDLGRDRAISRLRLLAGGTALNQLEYFVRGYRFETATERDPGIWRLLAENPENFKLDVDTQADGTWKVNDEDGIPAPRVGRFVRLTLVRQDRSNWVAIGEVEVFGDGLLEAGHAVGGFSAASPVNVGRLRWKAITPEATGVEMQFRSAIAADWDETWGFEGVHTIQDGLFKGEEPLSFLQFRANLSSKDPFATSFLESVEIEYDPVLVAGQVLAAVAPDTARKGAKTPLTLEIRVEAGGNDYGVDMLQVEGIPFEIDEVRVGGRLLLEDEDLQVGYRWRPMTEEGRSLIELAPTERIDATADIEISGSAVFVVDRTQVLVQAGSLEQSQRDGYVNWQNASQLDGEGTVVRAFGAPPKLLSQVEVGPSPYSPFEGGTVDFRFVVANLRQDADIDIDIFSLDGRRVRRLRQTGQARAYNLSWDGRDGSGRVVDPGLYIYEIRIDAGAGSSSRRGTTVVAY